MDFELELEESPLQLELEASPPKPQQISPAPPPLPTQSTKLKKGDGLSPELVAKMRRHSEMHEQLQKSSIPFLSSMDPFLAKVLIRGGIMLIFFVVSFVYVQGTARVAKNAVRNGALFSHRHNPYNDCVRSGVAMGYDEDGVRDLCGSPPR